MFSCFEKLDLKFTRFDTRRSAFSVSTLSFTPSGSLNRLIFPDSLIPYCFCHSILSQIPGVQRWGVRKHDQVRNTFIHVATPMNPDEATAPFSSLLAQQHALVGAV